MIRLGLVFALAVAAWPAAARACVCEGLPPDLASNLSAAKEKARNIYLVRVGARGAPAIKYSTGTFVGEVLEVFKGELKVGQKLSFQSGNGITCRFALEENSTVLAYANGAEPDDLGMCGRTRAVAPNDAELAWLRSGTMPKVPGAARRETVTCQPCTLQSVANQIFDAPAENGGMPRSSGIRLVGNLKRMGPFWTMDGERAPSSREAYALGKDLDGGFFELRQTPFWGAELACQQRVERRECGRLQPMLDAGTGPPYFRCLDPGPFAQVCDESASRTTSLGEVEAFTADDCRWRDPTRPVCLLGDPLPLDGGTDGGVATCRQAFGLSAQNRFVCDIDAP